MSKDLLALYQQIRETPAMTVDLPEESGKGHIVRLDTNIFSLSSWNMEFSKNTFVEGNAFPPRRSFKSTSSCAGGALAHILGWPQECKIPGQETYHPLAATYPHRDRLEERASNQHPYSFGKLIPEPKRKNRPAIWLVRTRPQACCFIRL